MIMKYTTTCNIHAGVDIAVAQQRAKAENPAIAVHDRLLRDGRTPDLAEIKAAQLELNALCSALHNETTAFIRGQVEALEQVRWCRLLPPSSLKRLRRVPRGTRQRQGWL
jgi:hypothetical protein